MAWRAFVGLALLATTTPGGFAGGVAGAADGELLELQATIPLPENQWNLFPMAVGEEERRLYSVVTGPSGNSLWTYDIAGTEPKLVATRAVTFEDQSTISYASPYMAALAEKRDTMYLLTATLAGNLDSWLRFIPTNGGAARSRSFAEILPGFYASGITYSAEDDLLYVVGEMSEVAYIAQATYANGAKSINNFGAIAALDPSTGSLVWARLVRECRAPMYTFQVGSLIARSSAELSTPSLVMPCTPGSYKADKTLPGQAGVAVVRIKPRATVAEAQSFPVEFFPIGGSYFNGSETGVAAYDPGADRLFLQSLSMSTPSAFVLDLRLGAWVGAITAPDNSNSRLGLDPATGHYFMGGGSGGGDEMAKWILVADGRATPPQNGVMIRGALGMSSNATIDSKAGRLIYWGATPNHTVFVKDRSTSVPPRETTDYDRQTDDVAETVDTFVAFTGDTGGFGARVTKIGDTGPVVGALPESANFPPPVSRAVVLARSGGTTVQAAGAAASAEAAALDTNTGQTLRDNPQLPKWPHGTTSCLDGGEGADAPPATSPLGKAEVRCALAAFEAGAEARHGGDALGVTIADAHFKSRAKRTAKAGMVTEARALSSGVNIPIPGGGALRFGRVSAEAQTTAHGQTKSGRATWKRAVEDVSVLDAAGKVVFSAPGCVTELTHDGVELKASHGAASCDQLAEAVRQALQVHVRIKFPVPQVVATPKGAFASVRQAEADRLHEVTVHDQGRLFAGDTTTRSAMPAVQVDVYTDSTERSRSVVQLATLETSAIYTINRRADDEPCDVGACIPGGRDMLSEEETSGRDLLPTALDPVSGTSSDSTDADTEFAAPHGSSSSPRGGTTLGPVGMVFTRRGLGQGSLMAAFVLLVGAAAVNGGRRRRLLSLVGAR